MEWTSEELKLFCDIQALAARTGLPIVISIFKHFSKEPGRSVGRSTILADIGQDENFEKAGYEIVSQMTVKDAIRNLIDSQFLRQDNDEIMLSEKGQKAIEILSLKKTEQI